MKRRKIIKLGLLGSTIPVIPIRSLAGGCDSTTSDIEGPFYTANAPDRNILYPTGAEGTLLFITGTIYYEDCETPVKNAELDVWQADDAGAYDNIGFDYRGKFETDALGNFSMETILPGKYLNGAQFRPRHIHFKIQGGGSDVLTTQLYFEGDDSIPIDPWASDPSAEGRIIPLSSGTMDSLHGVFDVYLDQKAPVSTNIQDTIRTTGPRILSIGPNPVVEFLTINYLRNPGDKISFKVFNIQGTLMREIPNKDLNQSENKITIKRKDQRGLRLNQGIYIIQLLNKNKPIDAKRIMIF